MAERTARGPEKRSYRKLHRIEIEKVKGDNGGHIVTHHYRSDGMDYAQPQVHVFGKGQGKEMLAHLTEHLRVPAESESSAQEEPEEAEG